MKISDILSRGGVSVSLEVFPPKREEGFARMNEVVERLCRQKPSFMSVVSSQKYCSRMWLMASATPAAVWLRGTLKV